MFKHLIYVRGTLELLKWKKDWLDYNLYTVRRPYNRGSVNFIYEGDLKREILAWNGNCQYYVPLYPYVSKDWKYINFRYYNWEKILRIWYFDKEIDPQEVDNKEVKSK